MNVFMQFNTGTVSVIHKLSTSDESVDKLQITYIYGISDDVCFTVIWMVADIQHFDDKYFVVLIFRICTIN